MPDEGGPKVPPVADRETVLAAIGELPDGGAHEDQGSKEALRITGKALVAAEARLSSEPLGLIKRKLDLLSNSGLMEVEALLVAARTRVAESGEHTAFLSALGLVVEEVKRMIDADVPDAERAKGRVRAALRLLSSGGPNDQLID